MSENSSSDNESEETKEKCECDKTNVNNNNIYKCEQCSNKFCEKCKINCRSEECISIYVICPFCYFLVDDFDLCCQCFQREINDLTIIYCKSCKNFYYENDENHNSHNISINNKYNMKKAIKMYPKLKNSYCDFVTDGYI